jgi:hypothetical protein
MPGSDCSVWFDDWCPGGTICADIGSLIVACSLASARSRAARPVNRPASRDIGIPDVRVGRLYVQVDVLSPTSRAGEALTSEPLPIRGFSLIRSNHGAVRQRQPVYRPRIPNRRKEHLSRDSPPAQTGCAPLTSLTVAAPCLCWQTLPDRLSA